MCLRKRIRAEENQSGDTKERIEKTDKDRAKWRTREELTQRG